MTESANTVQIRRLTRLKYGEALPADERTDGAVAVMSSGGITGSHNVANTTGPVIVIGRKGSFGSVHWSADPVFVIDTAYFVDRTSTKNDLRWLYYLLTAANLRSLTQDVGVPGLSRDAAYAVQVCPPPTIDEQRRIAAFLDDQVARIDQAISLSQSEREILTTRDLALLDGLMGRYDLRLPDKIDGNWKGGLPNGWRVIHLSQVLKQLTNGYVGPTRDILHDDGVRYIQSVHIKNGSIDFERRPFYVSGQWHRERPRINLRAEDVLIVQTGAIGQVAVVPSDFGPASCHALLIARVQPSIVSGRYLAAYLRSPLGFQSLLSRATGALHPHLEGGIKNVNVIVPPIDVQDSILLQLDELRRANGVVIRGLERRTVLLQERKRSLITAAVTGEFDVRSASTRALAGVGS